MTTIPLPPGTTVSILRSRNYSPHWETLHVVALYSGNAVTVTGDLIPLSRDAHLNPAPTYIPAPAGAVAPDVFVDGDEVAVQWHTVVAGRVVREARAGFESVEWLVMDADGGDEVAPHIACTEPERSRALAHVSHALLRDKGLSAKARSELESFEKQAIWAETP